jgi:hypothetical protein
MALMLSRRILQVTAVFFGLPMVLLIGFGFGLPGRLCYGFQNCFHVLQLTTR